MNLDFIPVIRKSGNENFVQGNKKLKFNLLDFWQWSASNLLGNTERGILAEYLVANDLGLAESVINDWEPYDLTTKEGIKVEVKSAAYLQSWNQKEVSKIIFSIRPTIAWNHKTNKYENEPRRQSDVYVFFVLAHKDQSSINPLVLDQWEFYVTTTNELNKSVGSQKSISLLRLLKLGVKKVEFGQIGKTINKII